MTSSHESHLLAYVLEAEFSYKSRNITEWEWIIIHLIRCWFQLLLLIWIFFFIEQNNTFPGTWYAVIDLASVFIYLLADLFIYIIKDHWGKVAFSFQEKQYTQGYINFLNLSYFSQQGTWLPLCHVRHHTGLFLWWYHVDLTRWTGSSSYSKTCVTRVRK